MRRAANGLVAVLLPAMLATSSRVFAGGQDWDIEVHGGAMVSSNPTKGTTQLPPPAPAITFPSPVPSPPIRTVPSWYFGDGASLLNQAAAARFGAGIVPLDGVLQSRFVERRSGTSVGIRVSRSFGARFAAEFGFDQASGPLALAPVTQSGIKASQSSFITTWSTLLAAPAGGSQSVGSDITIDDKRGRQLITTGALLINLRGRANVKPYVAFGAGLITARNGAPSVELVGNYHFMFPATPPPVPGIPVLVVDQTDSAAAGAVVNKTITWVIGGGLKYTLTERWGVRIDVRDHLNRDPLRTTISASPATASMGPSGTLVLFFAPSAPQLQFSTSSSSTSTLGGSPVVGFKTFDGTGIVNQVNMTAGIFWRF